MAKNTDYKEKDKAELTKLLAEARESLRKLRFEAAGARPKDSNAPKKARRDIARILTALGVQQKNASATAGDSTK